MLAGYFSEFLGNKVLALGKEELDIADSDRFEKILCQEKIECVINAAGLSTAERRELFDINAFYPAALARISVSKNIPFVYLSSARVFDGRSRTSYTEKKLPNPVDDYGLSKYLGEKLIQLEQKKNLVYIFRLPMVLGVRSRNKDAQVVNRLLRQAQKTGSVSVASDVFHSPVYAASTVRMIYKLLNSKNARGLYHISHGQAVSLYDLIDKIIQLLDIKATVSSVSANTIDAKTDSCSRTLGTIFRCMNETCSDAIKGFVDEYEKMVK